MNLSMEQAVSTLMGMFPNLEKEVIVEVLRSQRGHMERTCEILLEFQGEVVSPDEPEDYPAADQPRRSSADPPSSLPSDFLSVDRYDDSRQSRTTTRSSGGGKTEAQKQMEQDEALARALQHRMFLTELRNDPTMRAEFGRANPQRQQPTSGGSHHEPAEDSFSAESVISGMKTMGEAARRKLSLLSRSFNSRLKGDMPLTGSTQYRSLPVDDDDDEAQVIAFENSDRPDMSRRVVAPLSAGGGGDDDDDTTLEDRRSRHRHREPTSQRVVAGGGDSNKKDD